MVQMKEEPSSPVQDMLTLASAMKKKLENQNAAHDQSAEDSDSLDKGILDQGRQLTPIDDLASPEDSYFLGFEYTDGQADKMVLSPQDLWRRSLLLQSQMQVSDLHPDQQHQL